jgi:hypothetical protein
MSVSLPLTWRNTGVSPPDVLNAESPDGTASLEVSVSPDPESSSTFTATMYRRARQVYVAQDPKAEIRSRKITKPMPGIEVITTLVRKDNGKSYPLSVDSYAFFRQGKVIEFIYLTLTPKIGAYHPIFARSAQSIHFT